MKGSTGINMLNIGTENTTGPVKVEVELPEGLTFLGAETVYPLFPDQWDCTADVTGRSIECENTQEAKRKLYLPHLVVKFDVDPSASGTLTSSATISGGGAAEPFTAEESALVSDDPAGFGIVPGSFRAEFYEPDGTTVVRQAGSHPYQAKFSFDFNTIPYVSPYFGPLGYIPDETVRNLGVDLPTGFIGNPAAVGECTAAQLSAGECPRGSQVGRIELTLFPLVMAPGQTFAQLAVPVYNMKQPKGVITDLGFSLSGNPTHIRARLDPSDYSVETTVSSINESLPVYDQTLTVWGVPADPRHDWERCSVAPFGVEMIDANATAPCKTDLPRKAFLTVPSRCDDATHQSTLKRMDSWQHVGVFEPEEKFPSAAGFQPIECERQRFEPSVEVHPVNKAANSPTGLDVNIVVPPNENPDGLDTANVKKTVVTFPKGMTVSPSFADGLSSCSPEQVGLGTNDPARCPDSSRIGTVDLRTHILNKPLTGSMFLAKQSDNPFGALVAMYVVVEDTENRGIIVKVPGKIDLDQGTGQIVNTFDNLPQFPVSNLELHFRSGPRAPLINPPTCGVHKIGVEIASYADPTHPSDVSDTYEVDQGPLGSPCPSSAGSRPFDPKMTAGTVIPNAGSFSPFTFRMTRTDADQELSQIETTLPPGLLAKIKGISRCPDAAIAAISPALGAGRAEQGATKVPGLELHRHGLRGSRRRSDPQLFPRQGLPRRPLQRRAAEPGGRRSPG